MNSPDASSIAFTCDSCGRALQVPADAVGRSAKCPQCGNVQSVPPSNGSQATSAPPGSVPSQAAPPSPEATSVPQAAGVSHQEGTPPQMAASNPGTDDGPATPPASETSLGDQSPSTAEVSQLSADDVITQAPVRETPTKRLFDRIMREVEKIYVGQDELVLGALTALFSSGHVLIESVPGLGKTLLVRTLGKVLGCDFGRIQFTADLMPSDITGAPIFDMKTQEFRFRPGPVFTQLLLADEINRSPAKTHAALLEIMQEYRVTVDGVSHELKRPFLVLATQNPIESEGTYNLPEAQLDRFMFKLKADYPAESEEAEILRLHSRQVDLDEQLDNIAQIASPEEILAITKQSSEVRIDDRLIDYINKMVRLTRQWPQFHMGASPRAGLALMQACRTLAAFSGRDYAVPDDVVQIAIPALRHRVILTAEAEVEGQQVDQLLSELIARVEVPRI